MGIVPSLPGAHTQAATLGELGDNLKEVLELCLEEYDSAPHASRDLARPLQREVLREIELTPEAFLRALRGGVSVEPDRVPLAAALERGRRAKARLLAAEGGTLAAAEIAARLGISPRAVDERWRAGRLVAVEIDGEARYPAWQLVGHELLPGLEAVLAELRDSSPWGHMILFLNPNDCADGLSPLAALRLGRLDAALRAARAHGEHVAP